VADPARFAAERSAFARVLRLRCAISPSTTAALALAPASRPDAITWFSGVRPVVATVLYRRLGNCTPPIFGPSTMVFSVLARRSASGPVGRMFSGLISGRLVNCSTASAPGFRVLATAPSATFVATFSDT